MNKVARHPKDPAVVNMSLEEIAQRYTARFADIKPDWNVFGDSKFDGYRRAQYRYIGQTLGKPEIKYIPAGASRLSIMYVPPGEGNAPHTHPVEEVFFILQGNVMVFFEEEDGRRLEINLGPWDCVSCPAGVIHGFQNNGVQPVFLQVMVGQHDPDLMGYADPKLYAERDSDPADPK
jgi:mannose-6-phosphate isomerase-like protein (cupin superfamily)